MTDNDFLASLDAELTQLTAKPKLESDRKKLMAQLRDNRISREAKLQAQSDLALTDKLLDALIWTPISAVAFFVEQNCDCCASTHRIFLQHMEKQTAGKHSPVTRFKRVARPDTSLPTEVIVQTSLTHICADCCEDFGYEFPTASHKFTSTEVPFTISPNYQQEELYAPTSED